jgi:hypothetical protein
MTTLTFDAFEYAHQLREVGMTDQQAEVIAKKTSEILKISVESAIEEVNAGELASKRDLKELESALKRDLKELESALKRDLKELELALKRDLKEVEVQIEKSKNSTLLWMFTMLTAFAAGIVGIMAKGFHWF